jgi:type 1 glutamine amidotransferase
MKRILFQTGGPWHPVAKQVELIRFWLLPEWTLEMAFVDEALDRLEDCDLFVAGGMVWPEMDKGMPDAAWEQAGIQAHAYNRPTEAQKEKFRAYVRSGRPILAFHGGILCYEDWAEYGALLGFRWDWGYTGHSVVGDYKVEVQTDSHPVVNGVPSYTINDELYYNVVIPPELDVTVHARAQFAEWVTFPMVMTAEGGRCKGAGRTAYLANGHSMKSFETPELRTLWLNTIRWLLGEM